MIELKPICDNLGSSKSEACTALHSISGSDVTGAFFEKSKKSVWSAFCKATDDVVKYLKALLQPEELSEEISQI